MNCCQYFGPSTFVFFRKQLSMQLQANKYDNIFILIFFIQFRSKWIVRQKRGRIKKIQKCKKVRLNKSTTINYYLSEVKWTFQAFLSKNDFCFKYSKTGKNYIRVVWEFCFVLFFVFCFVFCFVFVLFCWTWCCKDDLGNKFNATKWVMKVVTGERSR